MMAACLICSACVCVCVLCVCVLCVCVCVMGGGIGAILLVTLLRKEAEYTNLFHDKSCPLSILLSCK